MRHLCVLLLLVCTVLVNSMSLETLIKRSRGRELFGKRSYDVDIPLIKRRANELLGKRSMFNEKRRGRELFGKRSDPWMLENDPAFADEDVSNTIENADDMYDYLQDMRRERRGRQRELLG